MVEEIIKEKASGTVLGFNLRSLGLIESSVIYVEAWKGSHIKACITEASELAKIKNTPVLVMFNDEPILVTPDSDPYELIDGWYGKKMGKQNRGIIILSTEKNQG